MKTGSQSDAFVASDIPSWQMWLYRALAPKSDVMFAPHGVVGGHLSKDHRKLEFGQTDKGNENVRKYQMK